MRNTFRKQVVVFVSYVNNRIGLKMRSRSIVICVDVLSVEACGVLWIPPYSLSAVAIVILTWMCSLLITQRPFTRTNLFFDNLIRLQSNQYCFDAILNLVDFMLLMQTMVPSEMFACESVLSGCG